MDLENDIKKLLFDKKMSIELLAAKIEMTRQNLANIFKRNSIETKHLQKIADVLEVPITYFFGNKTDNSNIAEIERLNNLLKECYSKEDGFIDGINNISLIIDAINNILYYIASIFDKNLNIYNNVPLDDIHDKIELVRDTLESIIKLDNKASSGLKIDLIYVRSINRTVNEFRDLIDNMVKENSKKTSKKK